MPHAFYILFGSTFAVAVCLSCGLLLLRGLRLHFYRGEERLLAFVTGAACLSTVVFILSALGLARKGAFLALGLAIIFAAARCGVFRPLGDDLPPLPRFWKILFGLVFTLYTVLYFFNAMAPEMSPDGSAYHLGFVAWYLREHGLVRITTNMYANLSQGIEMLYLFAFAFGRHSAAALVHFSFLAVLPFLMLSYAKRFGLPVAGAAAALLVYASPVVGKDGTTAYVDVAVAAIVFTLFYLLQIWDRERSMALFIPIGLVAGFAYAAKYTAFLAVPYALAFTSWKLYRARHNYWKPLVIISACALVMMLPWMAKNWIWVNNPFSPFFNRVFPNPYIHTGFEDDYSRAMQHYEGLKSYIDLPLELTVRGTALCGLFGPVFLLAPLALLSLRERVGRQLLLAGAVFGATYFCNIGTRFLIPAAPFFALAMMMVCSRAKAVPVMLVAFHAIFSWPPCIKIYSDARAWRLERILWKQALRIVPEDGYLNFKMPVYPITRVIEKMVPKGEKVFSFNQAAQSYTSREILVAYQSAFNNTLGEILWTPITEGYQPTRHLVFRFPPQPLRKVRATQTAEGKPDNWSIAEFRVFRGGVELPRVPQWRLRASPNPWEVQLAFDNSPVTRWRSWETLRPGMFVEIDFGKDEVVDTVRLECSRDQDKSRVKLEGQTTSGRWKLLAAAPEYVDLPSPLLGLRRAAAEEFKARGVRYILAWDSDYAATDLRTRTATWGITMLAERGGARLYRID
jgi:hypothetical protein